ncbi:MAG TPA: hypothetical protein VG826_16985 [Pirellulales bacterium]|nr:hypothetical protein [Pirellulales bacterium]
MCFACSWIVVASFVLAPISDQTWLSDYGKSLEATRESQRPLLVVIDQQPKWLAHVEPVSEIEEPVAPSLLKKYTLCHIDATTRYGKSVAQAFRTSTFPTTVIIDRTGSVQLATRPGRLSAATLKSLLVAHQDGKRPAAAPQPVCRT